MFRVQVDKSDLKLLESEPIVTNASGVYLILFSFSEEWDGFGKTAIFTSDSDSDPAYKMLLNDANTCQIPWELLKDPDKIIYLGLCGIDESGNRLPTVSIPIGQTVSGACQESTESEPPTPSIYDQLMAEIAAINKRLDEMSSANL